MSASPASRARLSHLLAGLIVVAPADDREIGGVTADSRRVRPGDLFLACAGIGGHGADFIPQALERGAAAVVYGDDARLPGGLEGRGVPLIPLPAAAFEPAEIAARYHGRPAAALTVVGITGTNGKTSCCHYLAQALEAEGVPCGVIGTLGYGPRHELRPASHTTPDAVTLQALLAEMRDAGIGRVVMEVSSHALDQGRVAAVDFDCALFTNLSHEHLDYHGDLASYARCKQRLFHVPGLRAAAINGDDPEGLRLLAALPPAVHAVAYGMDGAVAGRDDACFVHGEVLRADGAGLELAIRSSWGEGRLHSSLLGRFNAANLLASLSVLLLMEMPLEVALQRLAAARAVPGRMERFGGGDAPLAVVDYAHTPAALEAVLLTLRALQPARLWCVFGCGGERDADKRPAMGRIAERYAQRLIVTDDNPRGEDPAAIVSQILSGMARPAAVEVIHDRAAAIARALEQAAPGDVVLIAGKGHECWQLVAERRIPFSDREQVAALLGAAA